MGIKYGRIMGEVESRIAGLHSSPWRAVIACTGAGAGIQRVLWDVPGASATILDSVLPYDRFALQDFIGRTPEKYCSQDTALFMATAALRRATELALRGGGDPRTVMGVGLTASVATGAEKRGEHRAYIAVRTAERIGTVSVQFAKGKLTREQEGNLCDHIAVNAMLHYAGIEGYPIAHDGFDSPEFLPAREPGGIMVVPNDVPPLGPVDLAERPLLMPNGDSCPLDRLEPARDILFPGSFHPLHFGHELMAMQAERMTGKRVVFAITATHPVKGGLSVVDLTWRAEQFRWRWPVLFTKGDALYIEKARRFPGMPILIGADAALGILDPKYYGNEVEGRDAMLRELAARGTRFYVVGRQIGDRFVTAEDLPVPAGHEKLFLPVSGRWDVRSRDLR